MGNVNPKKDIMELTGMFVWRNVVRLGYCPLESFLSTEPMLDSAIICVDPTSDRETIELCYAISDRFSKVRVIEFEWPQYSPDGRSIGIATQYCLDQARSDYAINIQSDEVYPLALMLYLKENWKSLVKHGECISFKVLNSEHNAQRFQGGEPWDGTKSGDVWERGGMWNGKHGAESLGGAGYNRSIKMFKNCRGCGRIKVAHDGWSMDGCSTLHHAAFSEMFPIIHLHDLMRDHLIDIRRNAAEKLWQDQTRYGNYKASADQIEATRDEWFNDPLWTRTTSPFMDLLPPVAQRLIGRTRYEVDWSLLE
jgi:hypothetical protein